MLSERDAIARESSILIASAASDERLSKALLEIEKLNKELELEKQSHRVKVGYQVMVSLGQGQVRKGYPVMAYHGVKVDHLVNGNTHSRPLQCYPITSCSKCPLKYTYALEWIFQQIVMIEPCFYSF